MSTAEHKALVQRTVAAFNDGDLSAVDRLFAPDYIDHDPGRTGLPPGPAGVKLAWLAVRAAFPDLRASIADLVAEGDKVAVRGSIRGTHRGELMDVPPTGRTVRVTLIDVNRIAEGKLVERWAQADALGLLQQLGVIPGPLPAGPDGGEDAVSTAAGSAGADPEASRTVALRYADLLLNRHDLERASDVLAPDFVGHFPGMPTPVRGIAGWKANFGGFLAAFPDYRETVEEVLAEGDRVASRVTFYGTHRGEFGGLPPTGKTIAAGGMAFLRIADGRVVEQWVEADLVGLMQQLGAMPAPGSAAR